LRRASRPALVIRVSPVEHTRDLHVAGLACAKEDAPVAGTETPFSLRTFERLDVYAFAACILLDSFPDALRSPLVVTGELEQI
jgi:hypothetical protein